MRKIDLELKITLENISELERSCNELKAQSERKDSDMLGQNGKLEDEQFNDLCLKRVIHHVIYQ